MGERRMVLAALGLHIGRVHPGTSAARPGRRDSCKPRALPRHGTSVLAARAARLEPRVEPASPDRAAPSARRPARVGPAGLAAPFCPAEFARELRECEVLLTTLAIAVLSDRDEAQDAVQEAGLIALGKLDHFERGTSFPAWMAR